jgi:hypothetical protein
MVTEAEMAESFRTCMPSDTLHQMIPPALGVNRSPRQAIFDNGTPRMQGPVQNLKVMVYGSNEG